MTWYGADPGGTNAFGVAALEDDGSFKTWRCSSVDEALTGIVKPIGIGIDSPLWWSSGLGGGRFADRWLRKTFGIPSGTVQSANSLRGAVLIQGVTLALMLRRSYPSIPITESHPKPIFLALNLPNWQAIRGHFGLLGSEPESEHERDAIIGAVAAGEGSLGHWKLDLSRHVGPSELDPKATWFGAVNYWWPADRLDDSAVGVGSERQPIARYGVHLAQSSEAGFNRCPECHHLFRGKGWEGIDAHWKAKHQNLLPYEAAWPLIAAGQYESSRQG